jgi:hypothetical protein
MVIDGNVEKDGLLARGVGRSVPSFRRGFPASRRHPSEPADDIPSLLLLRTPVYVGLGRIV